MTIRNDAIEAFFKAYAGRMNNALGDHPKDDIEGTTGAFADFFVEASPTGVFGGKNDDEFRAKIPQGNAYYRSLGTQSMTIEKLHITPLNDQHAYARAHWKAIYKKLDGSTVPLEFEVIYFLQMLNDTPKIFAYIAGDERKAYEEHGIVPQNANA
jgi:hypothetical protein